MPLVDEKARLFHKCLKIKKLLGLKKWRVMAGVLLPAKAAEKYSRLGRNFRLALGRLKLLSAVLETGASLVCIALGSVDV